MMNRDQEDRWRDRAHRAEATRLRELETTPVEPARAPEPCALCVAAGLAFPNAAIVGRYCRVHLDREADELGPEDLDAAGAFWDRRRETRP